MTMRAELGYQRPPQVWAPAVVVVTAAITSPLAAVLLQGLNYSQLRRADEVRRCWRWGVGMLAAKLVFTVLPLPLSYGEWQWASIGFGWLLLFAWYRLYGRHFAQRVGPQALATTRERHPFFALLFGLGCVGVAMLAASVIIELLQVFS